MILYVLEFNNFVIKVGKTSKTFNERLRGHRNKERPINIVRTFHCYTQLKERSLILFCKRKGRLVRGNEWFKGLLFEDVVEYLQKHEDKPILPPIETKPLVKRKELKPKIVRRLQAAIIKDKKKRLRIAERQERKAAAKRLAEYRKCNPVRTPTSSEQVPWTCHLHKHKEFSGG